MRKEKKSSQKLLSSSKKRHTSSLSLSSTSLEIPSYRQLHKESYASPQASDPDAAVQTSLKSVPPSQRMSLPVLPRIQKPQNKDQLKERINFEKQFLRN